MLLFAFNHCNFVIVIKVQSVENNGDTKHNVESNDEPLNTNVEMKSKETLEFEEALKQWINR